MILIDIEIMQDLNCAARASVMKKNPPRVKRCVSTTSRQINSQILVSSAGINLLFNTNFFAGAGSWGADVDVGWLSSGSTAGRKRGRDWNRKSVCAVGERSSPMGSGKPSSFLDQDSCPDGYLEVERAKVTLEHQVPRGVGEAMLYNSSWPTFPPSVLPHLV